MASRGTAFYLFLQDYVRLYMVREYLKTCERVPEASVKYEKCIEIAFKFRKHKIVGIYHNH